MENIQEKADFLQNVFAKKLSGLAQGISGKRGKMNVRQMIEHISDYVKIANGKTTMAVITETEKLPRLVGFLESEKTFPENTPNSLMPEIPAPLRLGSKQEAIDELHGEINHFFEVYKSEAGKKVASPFFGELAYEQQVQLLYKHATHHLRQFGAM